MHLDSASALPLTVRSQSRPRTPGGVVDFVGRNPALVVSLTVGERTELLKILSAGVNLGWRQECAVIEAAAAHLLKAVWNDPAQLRAITDALGGPASIKSLLPSGFTDPGLRARLPW